MNKYIEKLNDLIIPADIFISPISCNKPVSAFMPAYVDRYTKMMGNICEANDLPFDPERDHIIELRFNSKEFNCRDIPCHSIHIKDEDGTDITISIPSREFMPAKLFRDCNEREEVEINLPVLVAFDGSQHAFIENGAIETIMTFRFKLSQRSYLPEDFETFQAAWKRLMKN